jgi:hypothetical protein
MGPRVQVFLFGFLGVLVAEYSGEMSVADLLRVVNGSEPAARLEATRELFRRGPAILPALKVAGAKPMRTITPPRGDAIYTLLQGQFEKRASSLTFGLHIEGPVTRDDVQRMGRSHGFLLEPYDRFNPSASPTCYVHLSPGHDLASVLKDILLTEAAVKTVNLNYYEHSEN